MPAIASPGSCVSVWDQSCPGDHYFLSYNGNVIDTFVLHFTYVTPRNCLQTDADKADAGPRKIFYPLAELSEQGVFKNAEHLTPVRAGAMAQATSQSLFGKRGI